MRYKNYFPCMRYKNYFPCMRYKNYFPCMRYKNYFQCMRLIWIGTTETIVVFLVQIIQANNVSPIQQVFPWEESVTGQTPSYMTRRSSGQTLEQRKPDLTSGLTCPPLYLEQQAPSQFSYSIFNPFTPADAWRHSLAKQQNPCLGCCKNDAWKRSPWGTLCASRHTIDMSLILS